MKLWDSLKKFLTSTPEPTPKSAPGMHAIRDLVRKVLNNPNLIDSGHVEIRGYTFILDGCMDWSAYTIKGPGFSYHWHSKGHDYNRMDWNKLSDYHKVSIWKIIRKYERRGDK